MEQQYKNPIKAEEIILDMPQDVSQDPNADALQKLKNLFPARSQFNITKDSDSEENFSAEITVGDNKYSGSCSKDGTPIGNWALKRGKELEIKITFQEKSDLFKITVQSQEELATFQTESDGQFVDGLGQLVLGSGKFTDGLYKDDKYNGEFLDNKFHGKGTFTSANGDKYEGYWKDNKFHGKGTFTCANGGKYEGDWKDGKQHGKGTLTYANGDIYEGEFLDNKFHGHGTLTSANGDEYEGYWKDDKQHGKGTYTCANGDKYEGEFLDNKFHGHGTYTCANDDRYEGGWKDGLRNGFGAFTGADGSKFEGEWQYDARHGKGTFTYPDGGKYDGDWKYGKRDGKGTLTYPDGEKYDGDWKNGKRDGQGTRTYANGLIYKGEFKNGEMMKLSNKSKEKNKIPTLLLRSLEIDEANRPAKYENDKFTGGEPVAVKVCKDSAGSLAAIEQFIKEKKEKPTEENSKCRIVFDQHGGREGGNDMSIDSESAKKILENLADAKFKEITISDLACNGGTAYHFLKVAQDFVKEHEVVVKVRSAPEDRVCASGIKVSKTDGGTERLTAVTLGTDGSGKSRELKVFTPESANVGNPELTNLKCKEEEKSSKSI